MSFSYSTRAFSEINKVLTKKKVGELELRFWAWLNLHITVMAIQRFSLQPELQNNRTMLQNMTIVPTLLSP